MAISTTFTLKFAGAAVERGLARVQSAFKSLGGVALRVGKSLLSPFAALTALFGAGALTAGLVSFVKGSSEAAASVESLTTQFTTLLGSTTAAKKRMEEITEFAAKTPFEISELAATSKLLEVMGGNLISTGDGLRLVGDAAAMAGEPLQEVGLHIGRVFSAITSGTSAGESVNRLQELGLITGATKIKFEQLAAAQKKGTAATLTGKKALKLLQDVMSKAQGGMDALSNKTEGKLSNMKDNLTQLKVAFGTGFNDGLKIALDAANTKLPQLMAKFAEFGTLIGNTISDAVNGDLTRFFMIGNMIGEAVMEGMRLVIESQWVKLGQFMQREILGGTEFFTTQESRARDKVKDEADRKQLLEGGINDFMKRIKMQYAEAISLPTALPTALPQKQGNVPGAPGYRYAQPGEPATIMGNDRVVRILDSIDKKLSPVP